MIDYNLFQKLSDWVIAQYPNRVYQEESPRTYTRDKISLIWKNIGVRLIHMGSLTLAVLFEYDENDVDAGVYVGVKCLDSSRCFKKLSSSLNNKMNGGQTRACEKGAHKRLFSWAYWQKVSSYSDGIKIFQELTEETESFILNSL